MVKLVSIDNPQEQISNLQERGLVLRRKENSGFKVTVILSRKINLEGFGELSRGQVYDCEVGAIFLIDEKKYRLVEEG